MTKIKEDPRVFHRNEADPKRARNEKGHLAERPSWLEWQGTLGRSVIARGDLLGCSYPSAPGVLPQKQMPERKQRL